MVRLILVGLAWLLLAGYVWTLVHTGRQADQDREALIRQFRATDRTRDQRGLRQL